MSTKAPSDVAKNRRSRSIGRSKYRPQRMALRFGRQSGNALSSAETLRLWL